MPGSNPKGDRSSIASISASSTISIPSYEPSASKPRDFNLKREQNPRYRQHNGLTSGKWISDLQFFNHLPLLQVFRIEDGTSRTHGCRYDQAVID
jgi:hypothetical protein